MGVDYHAWTHRPKAQGGTDPIEVAASELGYYAPEIRLLEYHTKNDTMGWSTGWTSTENHDAHGYSMFYVTNTGDAAYWTRTVRLGPQGSFWSIFPVVEHGPDCGRLKVQLATLDEPPAGYGFDLADAGMVLDTADATFYDLDRQNGGVTRGDFYQSGVTAVYEGYQGSANWSFRMMGAAGTALTAAPVWDTSDGAFHANGGPGMWAIRFLTDGKNASSSGFKARYHTCFVRRHAYPAASKAL